MQGQCSRAGRGQHTATATLRFSCELSTEHLEASADGTTWRGPCKGQCLCNRNRHKFVRLLFEKRCNWHTSGQLVAALYRISLELLPNPS